MPAKREHSVLVEDGVTLAVEDSGAGPVEGTGLAARTGPADGSGPAPGAPQAIVLLHGLTATRRYVVMGSTSLQRAGLRVVAYDARAHGRSSPAPGPDGYGYERLGADLGEVLDALGLGRVVLVGASMGAHTALRYALTDPRRVAALALITPSYDPAATNDQGAYGGWEALADGLRKDGVEGFMAAYDFDSVPSAWRETVRKVVRQRLSEHLHPEALADALEVVPRSRPFERFEDLARLEAPTLVVGSRDEADPGHPLAVAKRYAEAIPGARLVVEQEGRSPLAWQGGRLSKLLADLAGIGV